MPCRKIMLIRHAEKPTHVDDGVNLQGRQDPSALCVRGWQRAGAPVCFFAPRDQHFADPRIELPDAIYAAAPAGRSADWGQDRFDLVWVLTRGQDSWDFAQVPQLLLNDDLLEAPTTDRRCEPVSGPPQAAHFAA